jgi:hypothetical protein
MVSFEIDFKTLAVSIPPNQHRPLIGREHGPASNVFTQPTQCAGAGTIDGATSFFSRGAYLAARLCGRVHIT